MNGNSARVDTPGGFNMTVSGTVTDTASGKNGNALRVDTSGHNGYLDSTTDNGTTGSDRSYSFWAWFTSSGTPACYAIQEVSSGLFNMQLQGFNSGGPRFFGVIYDNTGVSVGAQTSVLSTGTWHHVVVTVDTVAKEMKVYIDTLLDLTLSRTLPLRSLSPAGRRFFRFVSGSEVRFDEMVIWSRVISGPEITDLNNGGAGLFY